MCLASKDSLGRCFFFSFGPLSCRRLYFRSIVLPFSAIFTLDESKINIFLHRCVNVPFLVSIRRVRLGGVHCIRRELFRRAVFPLSRSRVCVRLSVRGVCLVAVVPLPIYCIISHCRCCRCSHSALCRTLSLSGGNDFCYQISMSRIPFTATANMHYSCMCEVISYETILKVFSAFCLSLVRARTLHSRHVSFCIT